MMRRHVWVWGAVALVCSACTDEPLEEVTGGVAGTICNPVTGQVAEGVEVSVTYTDGAGFETDRTDTTDETGAFEIRNIADGTHTFHARGDTFSVEFDLTVQPHEVAVFEDSACRELAYPPGTGEIVGQICNRHVGSFVADATVSVQLPDGSRRETVSDAEGNFSLPDVPVGVHVVYVQAPGYSRTHQVEVKDGEQTLLEPQQMFCQPPDPNTTGKITGRVCTDPDADAGLAGVRVFLTEDIDGAVFETETDETGAFLLAGIPAPRTVQVRAERGDFFYSWADVEVFTVVDNPDGTALAGELGDCTTLIPDGGARYLVIDGFYDKIQNVLERMDLADITVASGNPTEPGALWAADIFGDYAALAEYDAVFINCGVSELEFVGTPDPVVAANLRQFVQSGGSLYVSDQAYDIIELTWPDRIDFLFADSDNSAAEFGVDGVIQTDVADLGLAQFAGQDRIDIDFNFGFYALIQEVAPGTTVYLQGDVPYYVNDTIATLENTPVTVGFTDGPVGVGGRVVFTSFHQESDATTGEVEVLDGPEDAVLRYLIFEL